LNKLHEIQQSNVFGINTNTQI